MHEVGRLLLDAAAGRHPEPDGGWRRTPAWRPGAGAVLAFTGHAVLAHDDAPGVPDDSALSALGVDGLGGAHHPAVLTALAGGGWVDCLDVVLALPVEAGAGPSLVRRPDLADHPRARHAAQVRDEVEVWGEPDPDATSLVCVARGLGGLAEVSLELDPARRGGGAGTALLRRAVAVAAARAVGGVVLACSAPGNVASLRAILAAGGTPLASVQLYAAAASG